MIILKIYNKISINLMLLKVLGSQKAVIFDTLYFEKRYKRLKRTTDKTMLIPAVLGAFIGTWATIEYKKRKEK